MLLSGLAHLWSRATKQLWVVAGEDNERAGGECAPHAFLLLFPSSCPTLFSLIWRVGAQFTSRAAAKNCEEIRGRVKGCDLGTMPDACLASARPKCYYPGFRFCNYAGVRNAGHMNFKSSRRHLNRSLEKALNSTEKQQDCAQKQATCNSC